MWRWDEPLLDHPDTNDSGVATFSFTSVSLPGAVTSDTSKLRFRWVTNGVDNAHEGCSVDNLSIRKFSDGSDEAYGYSSGTSMAAPHVAGAAALLWAFNPTLTIAQVKNALMNSGDTL